MFRRFDRIVRTAVACALALVLSLSSVAQAQIYSRPQLDSTISDALQNCPTTNPQCLHPSTLAEVLIQIVASLAALGDSNTFAGTNVFTGILNVTGQLQVNGAAVSPNGGSGSDVSWTSVSASMTISAPGRYVVRTAGITITLPTGGVGGDVLIKDGTGSSSPEIALSGTIDAQSGLLINTPYASVSLAWDADMTSYLAF